LFPRHIHQYWGDARPPEGVFNLIQTWRCENPEFKHSLWSDSSARRFIGEQFGPQARACFDACLYPAMRADVFRVAVLFVWGGFYIDADEGCAESIAPLEDLAGEVILHYVTKRRGGQAKDRIGNAFMAARPGARFLGRLLTEIFSAIIRRESKNLWLVTGPGKLNQLYSQVDEAEKRTIIVLTRKQKLRFAKPDWQLPYKRESSHWSVAQKRGVETINPAVLPKVGGFDWARLVFLGHPRCGSASLANTLLRSGLQVGHEKLGLDGIVSWWHTGRLLPKTKWPVLTHSTKQTSKAWIAGNTFLYLRNPKDAIPSIVLENEAKGRENNSFRFRRHVLNENFGIDIGDLDPPVAAAASYALWNRLAELSANCGHVLVERPDLKTVLPGFEMKLPRRINTSLEKFRTAGPIIDLMETAARVPGEVRPWLDRYIGIYDSLYSAGPDLGAEKFDVAPQSSIDGRVLDKEETCRMIPAFQSFKKEIAMGSRDTAHNSLAPQHARDVEETIKSNELVARDIETQARVIEARVRLAEAKAKFRELGLGRAAGIRDHKSRDE
jgi:Glycosyltransferase sugar-binding region containing DXD motif